MAGNSRELLLPLLKEHESESISSTIILMIESVVSESSWAATFCESKELQLLLKETRV